MRKWVGKSIYQPTSLLLLLVPNLISLKFPLKVQMGSCRIWKISKLQFSKSRPGKALTFSIACSWMCLSPPFASGQSGNVRDPWEIHMQRQEPLEGKLWEQGIWLMKCHVWKPSGSLKLALSNTSYELNVKNVEQNLYLAVEGCLRDRIFKSPPVSSQNVPDWDPSLMAQSDLIWWPTLCKHFNLIETEEQ